jgi:hypothetical protein
LQKAPVSAAELFIVRRFVPQVVEIKGYDPDRDEYDFAAIFQSEQEPL